MTTNQGNKKRRHSIAWVWPLSFGTLAILVFGKDILFSGGYAGTFAVGVLVAVHIWVMFRGHGSGDEDPIDGSEAGTTRPNASIVKKKNRSCCH